MKQIFIAMFIFFSIIIFFALTNAGELYKCIDRDNNIIITDTPQDGMTDCVLKASSDNSSPKEREKQQQKSYKIKQESQREKTETEKERAAGEQEEAALLREGNKCYTQALNVISGGSVSGVYYWRICKDKFGNIVSKRRL